MIDRARAFGLLTLLALAACSDFGPTAKASSMPRVGTYAYVGSHATAPGVSPARTYTGTIDVSASSRTEVSVTWQVPEFAGSQEKGPWNGDAYRVLANLGFGIIEHQIVRSGEGLSCTAVLIYWSPVAVSEARLPVACSLVFQGGPA